MRQLLALLTFSAVVALIGTLVACARDGVFFPFEWVADHSRMHYGIMMDAGSHGTRAHLYSWKGRVEDVATPLFSPVTIPREELTLDPGVDGMSRYMDRPGEIGPKILQPLIDGVITWLDDHGVNPMMFREIPLYVKATAGLRNMDVDTRDLLMVNVREYLHNKSNNPFKFRSEWARTISGEEEGVFAWIGVNVAHETLLNRAMETIGALDLGGASSQITFMPGATSVLEDFYELNLGERNLRLYSHSFLGYGWGDSQMRMTTRLALMSYFNLLHDGLKKLNDTDIDLARLVLSGGVRGIRFNHPNITRKAIKKAIYLSLNQTDDIPIAVIKSAYPCFPVDYSAYFDIPSLIYPNGRYFLDIDIKAIIAYIDALGMNLDSPVIRSHFPQEIIREIKRHPLSISKTTSVMERITTDAREQDPFITKLSQQEEEQHGISVFTQEELPFHPFSEPTPMQKFKIRIAFKGTGNFAQCQALARELFYQEPCFLSTCSYNGVYQPRITESKFLALGQYAKIRSALDLSLNPTPNALERKIAQVCAMHWSDLSHRQNIGDFHPFGKHSVASLCWKGIWAHATLTAGYGFDGESRAVTFFDLKTPSSNITSPGWALGAMLAEISFMPWESTRGRFVKAFWWSMASSTLFALLALALYCKIRKLRSCNPRSDIYVPFSPDQSSLLSPPT